MSVWHSEVCSAARRLGADRHTTLATLAFIKISTQCGQRLTQGFNGHQWTPPTESISTLVLSVCLCVKLCVSVCVLNCVFLCVSADYSRIRMNLHQIVGLMNNQWSGCLDDQTDFWSTVLQFEPPLVSLSSHFLKPWNMFLSSSVRILRYTSVSELDSNRYNNSFLLTLHNNSFRSVKMCSDPCYKKELETDKTLQ